VEDVVGIISGTAMPEKMFVETAMRCYSGTYWRDFTEEEIVPILLEVKKRLLQPRYYTVRPRIFHRRALDENSNALTYTQALQLSGDKTRRSLRFGLQKIRPPGEGHLGDVLPQLRVVVSLLRFRTDSSVSLPSPWGGKIHADTLPGIRCENTTRRLNVSSRTSPGEV
jgi:hypothetical protein